MLRWKLHELLARKRVSGAELARRMNVHINTVDKLRQDRPTMLRFEYIEAICDKLPCEPIELFEVIMDMEFNGFRTKQLDGDLIVTAELLIPRMATQVTPVDVVFKASTLAQQQGTPDKTEFGPGTNRPPDLLAQWEIALRWITERGIEHYWRSHLSCPPSPFVLEGERGLRPGELTADGWPPTTDRVIARCFA